MEFNRRGNIVVAVGQSGHTSWARAYQGFNGTGPIQEGKGLGMQMNEFHLSHKSCISHPRVL